ncbi:HEPN domain-containing protein [Rheinheimera sp. 4Y26]|uniref:HEPN domain-containing protein n=1 Tax=Rheinheimera sp. 4Y26 TaxID=2977811 RepID=UPI0021B0975B|nr:HEPN domain-containing protein [Rheinheimera sp. 4Y26]MCT6700175.1 HEPN domain-containing protein [Rheinheimera sp. 4Y26]
MELNYVHSLRCKDELEHFEILPSHTQADIERYIVDVICDSFVKPADEDYVTARLLAQKGMHRAFFWAASQALEKYLKAFLLMRGKAINQKRFDGHPITALHSEACSIVELRSTLDTKPHTAIKINSDVSESIEIFLVDDFIKNVEEHGCPDNRYNAFGVDFNSGLLFALDSYVFSLRKHIGVPPIQNSLSKMEQGLIEAFYSYNPWFTPEQMSFVELPNENFYLTISSAVTTLDYLTGPGAPSCSSFVIKWLDRKMKLPKKIKHALKDNTDVTKNF